MNTTNTITLQTAKGDITLELYPDLAPNTVANFKRLASEDFYDGVIFHRVIEGFMIQGGDPTGTGTGGPGYTFEDELKPSHPEAQKGYVRGTLAMANAGPDTNGSQFFVVHQNAPLPYDYTIFGRVTEGMEVVDAIASVETNGADKPLEDIVINDVIIKE
ncbi:MAG: peptidylprolyl isomerase [Candidatus Paceibacterota bacterium]